MSKEVNWKEQIMDEHTKVLEAKLVTSFLEEEQEKVLPNKRYCLGKIKEEFTPNIRETP